MTKNEVNEAERVNRRGLLRGSAVLAGAAGATVVGAALAPSAEAADGDMLIIGQSNEAESQTGLTIAGASAASSAALALTNQDGPSLFLNPLDESWSGELQPGQIVNTTRGPVIGITQDGNNLTTSLLTAQDVLLPFLLPQPMRLLDTRTEEGRQRITLPSPLDSDGRLPARTPLTIWIAPAGEGFGIPGVHLNLTVVGPAANGFARVYPGPDLPDTSTINFAKGQTIANGALVATSVGTYSIRIPGEAPQDVEAYVIKIYTTAAAWIVIDASGAYAEGRIPIEGSGERRRDSVRGDTPLARARRALRQLRN